MIPFKLSDNLNHTWIFDLDGTILKHNGWQTQEELLPGVKELWEQIPNEDCIILMSARNIKYKDNTLKFLDSNGVRYDHCIFDLPTGERILINDKKPQGLLTAIAWNMDRDKGFNDEKI